MLTGKAKTDFNEWLDNKELIEIDRYDWLQTITLEDVYNKLPQTMQTSAIVEWIDSVRLYIEPMIIDRNWWGYHIVREDLMGGYYEIAKTPTDSEFKTRQEALNHAIETSNKIYNEN